MKLTILLGAGFSYNAKLPLAKDIAQYFDRDLRGKLLCQSSSEWYWIDNKSEAQISNGKLNPETLAYSYIFNAAVQTFKTSRETFTNYEEFYQYLVDITGKPVLLKDIFRKAEMQLKKDRPYITDEDEIHAHYLFPFRNPQTEIIKDILSYLINDLLVIKISDQELRAKYKSFIDFLKKYENVDIFTLNHDLVVERLFELYGIPYSRGFETSGSNLIHRRNHLPVFKNEFPENVRLFKLHGSVDFYQYKHIKQTSPGYYIENGEVSYFHTIDYFTKHNLKRIDPNTGKVVQKLMSDVVPKFITGTKKTQIIGGEYLFKTLNEYFTKHFQNAEKILVSGYSFSDEHINSILKSIKPNRIINQNPYQEYPYGQSIEIKQLEEMDNLDL